MLHAESARSGRNRPRRAGWSRTRPPPPTNGPAHDRPPRRAAHVLRPPARRSSAGLDADALRGPAYPVRVDGRRRALAPRLQRGDLPAPASTRRVGPARARRRTSRRSGPRGTRSRPTRKAADGLAADRGARSTRSRHSPTPTGPGFRVRRIGPLELDFDGLRRPAPQRAPAPHLGRRGRGRPGRDAAPGAGAVRRRRARADRASAPASPDGGDPVRVHTDDPRRDLTLSLGPDARRAHAVGRRRRRPISCSRPRRSSGWSTAASIPTTPRPVSDAAVVARLRAVFPGP